MSASSLPPRDARVYEQYAAFSPDGREYYVSISNEDWFYVGIERSVRTRDGWSAREPLRFAWGEGRDAGEPFVSPDGRELYFVSARQGYALSGTDIYRSLRVNGEWQEPVRLAAPVNSSANEWRPTLSRRGLLCFASEREGVRFSADIYCARRDADGEFRVAKRLPSPINDPGTNDSDPFIASDESFLLFHSDRPGGFGEHDLYVSFAGPGGTWSAPRNLGARVNSAQWEMGPALTPDGKTLMFTRREALKTATPSSIWFVPVTAVPALAP